MQLIMLPCFHAALAKYGKGQATDDLATAVEMLFERNILPRLGGQALLASNDFRTERLYTEEVDLLLKKHQNMLRALYSRYRWAGMFQPSRGWSLICSLDRRRLIVICVIMHLRGKFPSIFGPQFTLLGHTVSPCLVSRLLEMALGGAACF